MREECEEMRVNRPTISTGLQKDCKKCDRHFNGKCNGYAVTVTNLIKKISPEERNEPLLLLRASSYSDARGVSSNILRDREVGKLVSHRI